MGKARAIGIATLAILLASAARAPAQTSATAPATTTILAVDLSKAEAKSYGKDQVIGEGEATGQVTVRLGYPACKATVIDTDGKRGLEFASDGTTTTAHATHGVVKLIPEEIAHLEGLHVLGSVVFSVLEAPVGATRGNFAIDLFSNAERLTTGPAVISAILMPPSFLSKNKLTPGHRYRIDFTVDFTDKAQHTWEYILAEEGAKDAIFKSGVLPTRDAQGRPAMFAITAAGTPYLRVYRMGLSATGVAAPGQPVATAPSAAKAATTSEAAPMAPATAPAAPATTRAAKPQSGPPDVAAVRVDHDGTPSKMFLNMHEVFLKRGKAGPIEVLFIGDSITYGFQNCKELWAKYKPLKAANFAVGGNCTQHTLWQIENGELDGIAPRVVVLLIGTNNISMHDSGETIVKGETKIIEEIHAKLPQTKVLVLGIFPRAPNYMKTIAVVNEGLAKLDDGKKTRFLDISPKFHIPEDLTADYVHLNAKGYEVWAETMQPLLEEMMK